MERLKENIWSFFDLKCSLCRIQPASHGHLCHACHSNLPWIGHCCHRCAIDMPASDSSICAKCLTSPPRFARTEAAFSYRFPVSSLIPHIKHEQGIVHLNWMAQGLTERLQASPRAWPDRLIAVPSHPLRQLARGFNPAVSLAAILSNSLSIRLLTDTLHKIKRTPRQASLGARARQSNIKNSFTYSGAAYSHVALIDDVMTTGSTANEISRVLLTAGIGRVEVWVLARTPEPGA